MKVIRTGALGNSLTGSFGSLAHLKPAKDLLIGIYDLLGGGLALNTAQALATSGAVQRELLGLFMGLLRIILGLVIFTKVIINNAAVIDVPREGLNVEMDIYEYCI